MAEPHPPARPEAARDEEIRAATIGDPDVHNGSIELVDYDDSWPATYTRQAARVSAALGDRALRIEHVGSTSVPGLAAKPIIDMLLVVADSADEESYVPPMLSTGYALRIREPGWFEHRLLRRRQPRVNLHVFSAGCSEADRMLAFRDRLRTHDRERHLYLATKRWLAAQSWRSVQHYADAKTAVVAEILSRAAPGDGP